MGHHRDPLVGPRRAAERVRRCDHAVDAPFRHGPDLRPQELGLGTRLVGVRHAVLLREVPSGHRPRTEVDAGRQDEAVIGEAASAREAHRPRVPVDRDRPVVHDVDPVLRGKVAVAVSDRGEVAEAADVEVREEARVVGSGRLDEGHVHRALGVLRDVAGRGGPACAAPDHDDALPARREHGRRGQRRRCGDRGCGCQELAPAHGALRVALFHDPFSSVTVQSPPPRNAPRGPRSPRPTGVRRRAAWRGEPSCRACTPARLARSR